MSFEDSYYFNDLLKNTILTKQCILVQTWKQQQLQELQVEINTFWLLTKI